MPRIKTGTRPEVNYFETFLVDDQAEQPYAEPHGVGFLSPDLTEEELNAAPVLVSADTLLIDDLTVAEDESFAAALAQ